MVMTVRFFQYSVYIDLLSEYNSYSNMQQSDRKISTNLIKINNKLHITMTTNSRLAPLVSYGCLF